MQVSLFLWSYNSVGVPELTGVRRSEFDSGGLRRTPSEQRSCKTLKICN